MSRARLSSLTPNEEVARLASLLYHRVRKFNPYHRTRLSHKRRSLSGSVNGGPGSAHTGKQSSRKVSTWLTVTVHIEVYLTTLDICALSYGGSIFWRFSNRRISQKNTHLFKVKQKLALSSYFWKVWRRVILKVPYNRM